MSNEPKPGEDKQKRYDFWNFLGLDPSNPLSGSADWLTNWQDPVHRIATPMLDKNILKAYHSILIDSGTGINSSVLRMGGLASDLSMAGFNALVVLNYNYVRDKAAAKWRPQFHSSQSTALVDGASGANLLAAGTGKYRVFGVMVANGTAGKFAIPEINVAGMVAANQPIFFLTGTNGVLQNTTATAITIIGAGAPATLNCTIWSDDGSN